MPEREALTVDLGDGFLLIAGGLRRERDGGLGADLILQNGHVLFADRAILNSNEGRAAWAARATAEDRPPIERLQEAILELLPDALALLQADAADAARPSQADLVVALVLADPAVELFHDPGGKPYATLPVGDHRETWALRTKGFSEWAGRRYHERHGKVPGSQALADATNALAGIALYERPPQPVFLRLAAQDGAIYLDLGGQRWEAVEVDAAGWRLVAEPPVKFRRSRGMLALPTPVAGGDIAALRDFINVASDEDWALLVAWLVGAYRPQGPYAALIIHGEQGSAKSTTTRVLRALIDPNTAAIRSMPRDERDLFIAATNGWTLAFDNVSRIHDWLSDGFCRLATGGGFATRELYSDAEEVIFDAQRPLMINGIEEIATRNDFLDRSVVVYLPSIAEERRRPEAAFWRDFEGARPGILGALLDAVSTALQRLSTVTLPASPRMADFALWVTAAEPALGWAAGTFLAAYRANRAAANDLTLEAAPVSQAVRDFAAEQAARWAGTATELLRALDGRVDEATRKQKGWPASGRVLSNALRRLAPNLRAAGVAVTFAKTTGGKRIVHLERAGHPSPPSPPSPLGSESPSNRAESPSGDELTTSGDGPTTVALIATPSPLPFPNADAERGDGGDGGDEIPSYSFDVTDEEGTEWTL